MSLVRLHNCCLCLSPRTGSAVLGALCVSAFVSAMVPEVLLLQDHAEYMADFVREQRGQGRKLLKYKYGKICSN